MALASLFLITTSRERPWNDGSYVYFTAAQLVAKGSTALSLQAMSAPNGTAQSPHPLLVSLVHLPGVVLKRLGRIIWKSGNEHLLVLGSHLAPAVLAAVTCYLFFQMCLWLGLRRSTAGASTVMLAFCTIIWVYARSPWPPVVEGFVFTGFFFSALRLAGNPSDASARPFAIWSVLLLNVNWCFILMWPVTVAWLGWHTRHDASLRVSLWTRIVVSFAIGVGLVLLESRLRYGGWAFAYANILNAPMHQNLLMGLWGLLLSPGKSFLLYSPPLLFGLAGLCTLRRRRTPHVLPLIACTVGPFLLYLAKVSHWTGDWAWGPRFCVFFTPVLLVPAAVLLDEALAQRRRLLITGFIAAASFGFFIQVLGNGLYWDHYIRVAKHARVAWLGVPNRTGALIAPGAAQCDPCFEDLFPLIWLAPFNPVEGHAWLLPHVIKGDDAVVAERDAAWHRYTSLTIPITEPYVRARVDWWLLNFLPNQKLQGAMSLLVLLGAAVLGVGLWRRHASWANKVEDTMGPPL